MELVGLSYLALFLTVLIVLFTLIKRIYINKNYKTKDTEHFRIFVVMAIILPLLFIIIPFTNDVKPVSENSKIITTKEITIKQFIITDNDTLIYNKSTNTDTISTEVLPDSLKLLNVITRHTIYGALWGKEIE